ncbi:MAG: 50S ribosomal protein L29 [Planctomycetota bacterium]
MKPAEIRALSDTELLNELETATQRLFSLRFQRTTQNLESTAELRNVRRDIARMQTVLAERDAAAAEPQPAEDEGPDR